MIVCRVCKQETDWRRIVTRDERTETVTIYELKCGHSQEERAPRR